MIVPITNKYELGALKKAMKTKYESVNQHIAKAVSLYSKRKNPDYENSIKESISAVEAMCCIITGMTGAQATLGAAIKKTYGQWCAYSWCNGKGIFGIVWIRFR